MTNNPPAGIAVRHVTEHTMTLFYRSSVSRRVLCAACLPSNEKTLAVELSPDLFPGTFAMLECDACGCRPQDSSGLFHTTDPDGVDDVQWPVKARDPGQPMKILLIEDQFLLAACVKADLEQKGYVVLGPTDSVEGALQIIADDAPDAAVLDVNLHGELSWAIADALQKAHIPFVFATGYDVEPRTLRAWPAGRLIRKPYGAEDIERHLLTRLPAA